METLPTLRAVFTDNVSSYDRMGEPFAHLRQQIHLKEILNESVHSLVLFTIPSLREPIQEGKPLDVHRNTSRRTYQEIIAGLGLGEHPENLETISVRYGGASVVRALIEAAELVTRSQSGTVAVIAGVEKLSDLGTKTLVESAGKSVTPDNLYNRTLIPNVPMTLITAYALRESALLSADLQTMPTVRNRRGYDEHPLSGEICTSEIARADDGAFLAVVSTDNKGGERPVYIATGTAAPKKPITWFSLPADVNMAFQPLQQISDLLMSTDLRIINNFAISPGMNLELYECFFIAKIQQIAALLGIEKITKDNIDRILQVLDAYNPSSTLNSHWAAWGISSAKKVTATAERLKSDPETTHALIVGNGGVMDSIAAVMLTINETTAGSMQVWDYSEPETTYRLISDPQLLSGGSGEIDMIAYQEKVFSQTKQMVTQPGTTFVRVILDDGKTVVLTNLMLDGLENSLYQNLTGIIRAGQRVVLRKQNSIIVAVPEV